MKILDPGHIYELNPVGTDAPVIFKFVKRSGGAVTYPVEWPGIQTQAVMRALINFLGLLQADRDAKQTYLLWQLGTIEAFPLTLSSLDQAFDVTDVLIDRSQYLNNILPCLETRDACEWMGGMRDIFEAELLSFEEKCEIFVHGLRMALWCYEARAYRRKQEEVNRKQPEHDDTSRPRPWRNLICDDVPFNEVDIELRPIGDDGHIVLEKK